MMALRLCFLGADMGMGPVAFHKPAFLTNSLAYYIVIFTLEKVIPANCAELVS